MGEIEENLSKWLKQLKKHRKLAPEKKQETEIRKAEEEKYEEKKNFNKLVEEEAYFISLNNLSYNELCWLLAERKLSVDKGYDNITEEEIRSKAEEVFNSGISYDELCWLNAEVLVLFREHFLE